MFSGIKVENLMMQPGWFQALFAFLFLGGMCASIVAGINLPAGRPENRRMLVVYWLGIVMILSGFFAAIVRGVVLPTMQG